MPYFRVVKTVEQQGWLEANDLNHAKELYANGGEVDWASEDEVDTEFFEEDY